MYIWGYTDVFNSAGLIEDVLEFAELHRVKTLFLDMYGSLGGDNGTAESTAHVQALIGGLRAIYPTAKVFAVAGESDWAEDGYDEWTADNIVAKVVEYNAASTAPQRFDGFSYDIEYYVGETAPAVALAGLKEIYEGTQADSGGLPVGFFVAQHLFADNRTELLFEAKTATDGEHLVDLADHIVVGAYRDDGDLQIDYFEPWMTYASSVDAAELYVAANTEDGTANETYGDGSLATMETELAKLNGEYGGLEKFRGVVINEYESWAGMS